METETAKIGNLTFQLESKFPEIYFAYLFGSAASGNLTPSSDIDLAVYINNSADKLTLLTGIIGVAEKIFPGRFIDLLVLNNAGELVAMEALKGKILFVRWDARDLHAGFYSLTCRLSEDKRAWMKRQLEYRGYEVQWYNRRQTPDH